MGERITILVILVIFCIIMFHPFEDVTLDKPVTTGVSL